MTRFHRLVAMLFAALLGLMAIAPVAADDATPESVIDDPSQLEGIQYAVARSWELDFEALFEEFMASSPEADAEMDDPMMGYSGPLFAGGAVFEFDNDDNAAAGYEAMAAYFQDNAAQEFGLEDTDVTVEELDDLGDQAFVLYATVAEEGQEFTLRIVMFQSDNYAVYTAAVGSDEDAAALADDLAGYIEEQADGQSGLGEFNEDGTSTGGLWDMLPAADDEMVGDLVVDEDDVIHPDDDEDDEA